MISENKHTRWKNRHNYLIYKFESIYIDYYSILGIH